MCSKISHSPKNVGKKTFDVEPDGIAAALQYTMPVLRRNKNSNYIEFHAFDPALGKMHRKRIKLNRIQGAVKLKQYANEVIRRLTDQLSRGWNPWINKDVESLDAIADVFARYERHLEKMLSNGGFRKETYDGYKSNIKILREYIAKKNHITYVYQFDRRFCVDFLDYVFIDRNNGAQTRNNYLNFLRVLSGFMLEKGYIQSRPTDGIAPIAKRLYQKERTCIPLDVVAKIAKDCEKNDPHFLLACYLLYYGFLRPVEQTRLKVKNFNLSAGTITIPSSASKNKKEQTITVPKKVLLYAVDLGVFTAPMEDYIFSDGLKPGPTQISPKHFRDHWAGVRKRIGLKSEWKFYSLKDTGITAMLQDNMPAINVRDQARHSSLAITELYTDHSGKVNEEILKMDGAL